MFARDLYAGFLHIFGSLIAELHCVRNDHPGILYAIFSGLFVLLFRNLSYCFC